MFVSRYEECLERSRAENQERKNKQSWLQKFFSDYWTEWRESDEIYCKHVPPYLRGEILGDWNRRVKGLADDHIILMDVDDAKLLRQIAEKLDQPTKKGEP